MAIPRVALTQTRFEGLNIRSYYNVCRVGVPGHKKPFNDTWHRYCLDGEGDVDRGPSFKTKGEALAGLKDYAADNGIPLRAT